MSKEAMKLALEALDGIYRYGLDTLSGRSDGLDDRDWQRAGVNEMTKRARFGITALKALAEQPAQQEPFQNNPFDCGVYLGSGKDYAIKHHVSYGPAQQEPVAWKLVPREPTHEMLKAMDECSTEGYDERLYAGHAASVYMAAVDAAPTPPAQRKPLTDEEIILIVADCASSHQHTDIHFARAIERAHGIKELV